jgi:hypothetical protein
VWGGAAGGGGPPAPGAGETSAAADNPFGVPAHLLERAKAARARREAM